MGAHPTFIYADEAWTLLSDEVSSDWLFDAIRTFRKRNAGIILATQSLTEIANSSYRDLLLESCPGKIFLPNPEASGAYVREAYLKLGLSEREIEIIAKAAPRRQYFFHSAAGRRLFTLNLGPIALRFCAATGTRDVEAARALLKTYGPELFCDAWLGRLPAFTNGEVMIALLVFILWLISAPAYAQFGGTLVSDPLTEQNTGATVTALGTANATLAQIQTSDALTAASVTTPGDPGLYQGVAQYLDGLDSLLTGAGVSAASMAVLFPGWVPLLPDAIPEDETIATVGLTTYENAIQAAQTQAADFDAENTYLASIESANVGSASLLGAVQINTEAQLATATQIQMLRQLVIAQITVEALRNSEELNERAQQGATDAQALI
jgi:hypothetical protein